MLEYELEKGAKVSQIIWERTQISCLSTYSNIWWWGLEAEIIDLSIFSELKLSFVFNYVCWRRGLYSDAHRRIKETDFNQNCVGPGNKLQYLNDFWLKTNGVRALCSKPLRSRAYGHLFRCCTFIVVENIYCPKAQSSNS